MNPGETIEQYQERMGAQWAQKPSPASQPSPTLAELESQIEQRLAMPASITWPVAVQIALQATLATLRTSSSHKVTAAELESILALLHDCRVAFNNEAELLGFKGRNQE